jgi:hypothetical protein
MVPSVTRFAIKTISKKLRYITFVFYAQVFTVKATKSRLDNLKYV